jgi:hypothetical protein
MSRPAASQQMTSEVALEAAGPAEARAADARSLDPVNASRVIASG